MAVTVDSAVEATEKIYTGFTIPNYLWKHSFATHPAWALNFTKPKWELSNLNCVLKAQ